MSPAASDRPSAVPSDRLSRSGLRRRLGVLGAALLLPYAAVLARLLDWQVARGAEHAARAEANTRDLEVLAPIRGEIRDATGVLLAGETPVFGLEVVAGATLPAPALREAVAGILGVPPAEAARLLRRGDRDARVAARVARERAFATVLARLASLVSIPERDLLARAAEAEGRIVRREENALARGIARALEGEGSVEAARAREAARTAAAAACEAHAAAQAAGARGGGEPVLLAGDPAPAAAISRARGEALAGAMPGEPAARERLDRAVRTLAAAAEARRAAALRYEPLTLIPEATEEQWLAVDVRGGEDLPGVRVAERGRRRYPLGAVAAQLLGSISFPGLRAVPTGQGGEGADEYEAMEEEGVFRRDLEGVLEAEDYQELERRSAFRRAFALGRTGVEAAADRDLRGRLGVRVTERDAQGRRLRDLLVAPPQAGAPVRLTIRADLQAAAEKALRRPFRPGALPNGGTRPVAPPPEVRRAAAVLLEVRTGAILACASAPGHDANALVPPVSPEAARVLFDPEGPGPTLHRASQGLYPPGSVWKVVVASALLADGRGSDAFD